MTGSRPAARGAWLLLACSLALAVCGYLLLDGGQGTTSSGVAAESSRSQESPQPRPPKQPSQDTPAPQPSVLSTPPPTPPPRGEGRAADRQVQQLLEKAWPADLPASQEQQLRRDGALLLRADTTGVGRDRFPQVFGDRADKAVAPAFSRFRIQAAIARKDTRAGQAVVHLVWAAADRGGTYSDGRIADLIFHRTKGHGPWTPLPRPRP
ncbi:hypothetical protein AB0I94_39255 [Streptomyces sp. NPDC050147]|uniref:hypothetical protein n=1 Tax=Streptomyces sp. NPDC050147 TaxID=3155513 RepID=UPI00343540E1